MSIFKWDDSLVVHVEVIDRQHRKLVEIINTLAESMALGKGRDELGRIISGLKEYTQEHFRTEEAIIDQYNYPESAGHKEEHAEFVDRVSSFNDDFQAGRLGITVEILNFLCDWLRDHIKGSDGKIGRFINEQA